MARRLRVPVEDRSRATLHRRFGPAWEFHLIPAYNEYIYRSGTEGVYSIQLGGGSYDPIWIARWAGRWVDATDAVGAMQIEFHGYGRYVYSVPPQEADGEMRLAPSCDMESLATGVGS